ncbi:hypothetical protein KORDIASMS9_02664 [Kordia sp. SMS9]|uniref:hypothetical protein n=1 Tax=Kordia sp. SMS9 TaxID=2282170 RepID=UPI000E0D47B5|nr:hypothetical protein [Kordia sp. SMS9]AXG70424.1 hypothetical protein KORDIASMS9_02664 [Kordia sp. SMS9]
MKKSIEELKAYFETGDTPSQEEFGNLIDSLAHKDELAPVAFTGSYEDLTDKPTEVIIPLVAKSTIEIPTPGLMIRDSEDENKLKLYDGEKWCAFEMTCEAVSVDVDHGIQLRKAESDYLNFGDIKPQPNQDFKATIVFRPDPELTDGESANFISRMGGSKGVNLKLVYGISAPEGEPVPNEPNKIIFQLGDGTNIIVREIGDLDPNQIYTLSIIYYGSAGRFGPMELNGVSIFANPGFGSTIFDVNYTIDYETNDFTARNVDALYGNISSNGITDYGGSFDLFYMSYEIGGIIHTYPIEESSGDKINADEGNTATILGTPKWITRPI